MALQGTWGSADGAQSARQPHLDIGWTSVLLTGKPNSKASRPCTAASRTFAGTGDALQAFGASTVPGAGRPPQTAESRRLASTVPSTARAQRRQQPSSARFTEKTPWPGFAEVLESALPRPDASDGAAEAPPAHGPVGQWRTSDAPPHGGPAGSTVGDFGNLASARRFVRGGGAPSSGGNSEGFAQLVPQSATAHGPASHLSSATSLNTPQLTLGGSSSSSSLLPGTVTHPPDPRWLQRELSVASSRLGRLTMEKSRALLPEVGSDVGGDVLRHVDLKGIEPGQVEFVRGLFGSCLPRPPERETEIARLERERRQIAHAEQVGLRVAQRILKRQSQLQMGDEGSSSSAHMQLLGGRSLSRGCSLESVDAIPEESPAHGNLGAGGACDTPHRVKSPQREDWKPPPKASGIMQMLRLHKDRGSRLMKVDQLRRSFWKCSSVTRTTVDATSVTTPRGRLRGGDQPIADRSNSIGSEMPGQRRRVLEPTGDPRVDAMQAAFYRYDPDDMGTLDFADTRSAVYDLGLQAMQKERRAVLKLIGEAMNDSESRDGISFGEFEALVPRLRDAIQELKRPDLQEWYTKGLDDQGRYDVDKSRVALEALGVKVTGISEWHEVMKIFEGFSEAVAGLAGRGRMKPAGQALLNRVSSYGHQNFGESTGDVQFELFEILFHQSQEALVAMRRANERKLGEELQLSEEQFDEFREDLVELCALWSMNDVHHRKKLNQDEVMSLLIACGCIEARSWLTMNTLLATIERVKEASVRRCKSDLDYGGGRGTAKASTRRSSSASVGRGEEGAQAARVHSVNSQISERSEKKLGAITEGNEEEKKPAKPPTVLVSFVEFLNVLRLVRRAARERRRHRLVEIFGRYSPHNSGVIATKDMSKLLRDIKMQPRTREEQMEMRRIFDEADENGEGVLAFPQFELLVQSMREHVERLARREEERYALELGYGLSHFRQLRHVFEFNVAEGTRLLFIDNLRKVMTVLQRRYSSEELLSLFNAFSRHDIGGIDAKGFLRMMHAIEIAKTHGQLK